MKTTTGSWPHYSLSGNWTEHSACPTAVLQRDCILSLFLVCLRQLLQSLSRDKWSLISVLQSNKNANWKLRLSPQVWGHLGSLEKISMDCFSVTNSSSTKSHSLQFLNNYFRVYICTVNNYFCVYICTVKHCFWVHCIVQNIIGILFIYIYSYLYSQLKHFWTC